MSDTCITRIRGRRVWDSRGRPTVEAEVHLAGGALGRAIAPAGASTGSGEACDLRDGGPRLGGLDVRRAVASVNGPIAAALAGADAGDQASVDRTLAETDGTPGRTHLGGNALIATSMAVAHAAAAAAGLPLWRHLAGDRAVALPLPEIQILGGGAHAARRLDLQDCMVTAPGAASFDEALEWTAEIYLATGRILAAQGRLRGVADEGGFWPEVDGNEAALELLTRAIEAAGRRPLEEVAISLDVAATQLRRDGRYHLEADGEILEPGALAERIAGWGRRWPILSVEDPLAEDDTEGMAAFTAAEGGRLQVVGDDFLVTSAARIQAAAAAGACNAVLIKPNQAGTLTEARAALDAARSAGFGAIVSARSGESEDVTIVHLAVGWGVPQLKVGSFSRSERMAKWNEALRIEEALGGERRFAGAQPLAAFIAERRRPSSG